MNLLQIEVLRDPNACELQVKLGPGHLKENLNPIIFQWIP
jgi:hypothetical protein